MQKSDPEKVKKKKTLMKLAKHYFHFEKQQFQKIKFFRKILK